MAPETQETKRVSAEAGAFQGEETVGSRRVDASALPLAQAISYLQHTIEKLDGSINRIDDLHDLRYKNLQLELRNVSIKLDNKASQQSVDAKASQQSVDSKASQQSIDELHSRLSQQGEELRGDIITIRSSVDLVLDLLKRNPG